MKQFLLLFVSLYTLSTVSQEIQSPSDFLGYELGTRFTRYHQVVDYYQYLSAIAPNNVRLQEYGKTNERRPLLLAFISAADNIKNLENIRSEHLKSTTGEGTASKAIVWLSYNVHGNESASTEASMQTVYELLTGKSVLLENTVVIIDPCVNPDGRDRYVNWFNQHKSTPYAIDPNSWEHHQDWWNGRSNHYMFDLNRDWAWLTQVESRQRLKVFNKWLPHVHVDFHEQGVDSPYYFAPAAEPFHEVITDFQRDFQDMMGKNHAKYFDAKGWFYFTKEVFDLLYPSYGDTYPTYNGSIGMTYEQGGSGKAGLGIINSIGDTLTLKDRIAHHLLTGLSTLEVVARNTAKLNKEFKKFYENKNYRYKSYVLNGNADKINALVQLLDRHEIKCTWGIPSTVKGFHYGSGKIRNIKIDANSLVIHTDQPKGTLAKVLLEPNAKLSDSLTYDSTAWSLPYAYGLDALASEAKITTNGDRALDLRRPNTFSENTYAFVADWKSIKDAQFLAELLQKGIKVRTARAPFSMDEKDFKRGSLIITKADNKNVENYLSVLGDVSKEYDKSLIPTSTGLAKEGKDFGSEYVQMVPTPKVAVLSGKPTATERFGEIWYFFEQQLHYPLTILDADYSASVDLSNYDVLILPDGADYEDFLKDDTLKHLKEWVRGGGKLIAMGEAIKGIDGKNGFDIKIRKKVKDSTAIEKVQTFDMLKRDNLKETISGAIFKAKVDNTHPLAFGYDDTYFTLKLSSDAYEYIDKGTVVYLEDGTRPISGFAGSDAQKKIANTLIFGVGKHGKGQVIYMVDNPLFRGFWENGKLFFANALFMVN